MTHIVQNSPFVASDEAERIDLDVVHEFLKGSYWAQDIPRDVVARSLRHSLCMGLYTQSDMQDEMIGFARAVTDYATFAYLGDVFVLADWRGRGLGQWLTRCLLDHPELQGLRRWMLATRDAHGVYAKLGFGPLENPSTIMTIHDPDIYKR